MCRSGNKPTVGFGVAYPVEVRVAHLVDGLGIRVACLVDAWSWSLMLDVAGFGFLVAVADGVGEKPETRHRQPSKLPDHWRNQSVRADAQSRVINHAPVRQLMAQGLRCRVGTS